MKNGVVTVFDKSDAMAKAVNALHKNSVFAGIPQDKAGRSGDGMNNATLGYIHNYGSPVRNIPAREFLGSGIKKAQDNIVLAFKEAAKVALDGNAGAVNKSLNKAGIFAVNGIRGMFTANEWEPLSPATLAKKGNKTNPLIDTGQLRKSISYVVRKSK